MRDFCDRPVGLGAPLPLDAVVHFEHEGVEMHPPLAKARHGAEEQVHQHRFAAADYLALAERFAAVIIEGIPRLGPEQRDAARRFNILIDALYEARTLLIASAEVLPEEIYAVGDGSYEFQRTVSRLIEMQSEDYVANRPRRK